MRQLSIIVQGILGNRDYQNLATMRDHLEKLKCKSPSDGSTFPKKDKKIRLDIATHSVIVFFISSLLLAYKKIRNPQLTNPKKQVLARIIPQFLIKY